MADIFDQVHADKGDVFDQIHSSGGAPESRGALGEAWEMLKGVSRGVVSIPAFMAQLSKLSPLSAEGNQLENAKKIFVDPVMAQHDKAAQDFAAGNTLSGLTRATLGSVPVVGPGILDQSERIADPKTRSGAIGETLGAAVAPEIPGIVRATPGVVARGVRAGGETLTSPGIPQIVGGAGELVAGTGGLVSGNPVGMAVGGGAVVHGAARMAEGFAKRKAALAEAADAGAAAAKQADVLASKLTESGITPQAAMKMNGKTWAQMAQDADLPAPNAAMQDRVIFNLRKSAAAKQAETAAAIEAAKQANGPRPPAAQVPPPVVTPPPAIQSIPTSLPSGRVAGGIANQVAGPVAVAPPPPSAASVAPAIVQPAPVEAPPAAAVVAPEAPSAAVLIQALEQHRVFLENLRQQVEAGKMTPDQARQAVLDAPLNTPPSSVAAQANPVSAEPQAAPAIPANKPEVFGTRHLNPKPSGSHAGEPTPPEQPVGAPAAPAPPPEQPGETAGIPPKEESTKSENDQFRKYGYNRPLTPAEVDRLPARQHAEYILTHAKAALPEKAQGPAEALQAAMKESAKSGPSKVTPIREVPPSFSKKVYEASARADKANAMAQAMHEQGVTYSQAKKMPDSVWDVVTQRANQIQNENATAQGLPEPDQFGTPSRPSRQQALFELNKLERKTRAAKALATEMTK